MTQSFSFLQDTEDSKEPIVKSIHLKWLIYYIIEHLELAWGSHADQLLIEDLKILQESGSQLLQIQNSPHDASKAKSFFEKNGGLSLFREIAFEIKEWVFIYEPIVMRESKERPKNKLSQEHDPQFLTDGYEVTLELFKDNYPKIKKILPNCPASEVTLGMLKVFLQTGSCEMPMVKPSTLLKKYKADFDSLNNKLLDLHDKLGDYKKRVPLFALKEIFQLGAQGIREAWRENAILVERIKLEYISLKGKESLFFQKSFLDKIQRLLKQKQESDELILHQYVELINNSLIQIVNSPDYGGSSEMETALDIYLQEEE